MIEVRPESTPAELIAGRPDEVDRLAARLARFATDAAGAAGRMAGLDATHWAGAAADLFREAAGPVPQQLGQAGDAFGTAARALAGYAQALRDGQRAAAQAIRMVEGSTPDTAGADRHAAGQLVERARADVETAAAAAAARLRQLAADAPRGAATGAATRPGGVTVRAAVEHELSQPEEYAAPADVGDSVRFSDDHAVAFADPAGDTARSWDDWAAQGGRELGMAGAAVLAGVGIAAVGLIGRRRRDRTALAVAGIDEAELRRRRDRYGPGQAPDGTAAARTGAHHRVDTWRTRLASTPRPGATVHVWTGSEADPLVRARRAEPVPMAASGSDDTGAVLRTGPPPGQGRVDPGARR